MFFLVLILFTHLGKLKKQSFQTEEIFSLQTPLHYAAAAENADMALEILLQEGATPNSKVKLGFSWLRRIHVESIDARYTVASFYCQFVQFKS